jgi:hypothetical protein
MLLVPTPTAHRTTLLEARRWHQHDSLVLEAARAQNSLRFLTAPQYCHLKVPNALRGQKRPVCAHARSLDAAVRDVLRARQDELESIGAELEPFVNVLWIPPRREVRLGR